MIYQKNNRVIIGVIFIAVIAIVSIISPGFTQEQAQLHHAPWNPEFVKYLEESKIQKLSFQTKEGHGLGYIPSPRDLSLMKGQQVFPALQTTTLPPTFDLRTTGRLTGVKDQGMLGNCWAFAAYGSLESRMLTVDKEWCDFSEQHMKNLMSNAYPEGYDSAPNAGGNYYKSMAYLARWSGPLDETDDPYDYSGSTASPTTIPPRRHIQDVLIIPDRSNALDNDNIKAAILNYGAIASVMYYGDWFLYDEFDYYYTGTHAPNHAICIVGWDDTYAAGNFDPRPPGPGAFICKNSWGLGYGQGGYFHISYYDSVIGKENFLFFYADRTTNYGKTYQYDPLGWVSSCGYDSNTAWFANIFTATANDTVVAVSFFASMPNSSYTIAIYTNEGATPGTGTLAVTVSGILPQAGYHTVSLNTAVVITQETKFSAVVRLITPGDNNPIPIEENESNWSSHAKANAGESWVSDSGTTWTDITSLYPNTNVCIKVFTASVSAPISNFYGTPSAGVEPLTVQFYDTSKYYPISSWFWDFGDNNTSTEQNPTHVYQNSGKYTVSLVAGNAHGFDTAITPNYIVVYVAGEEPIAEFYGTPTTGLTTGIWSVSVQFYDSSTGGMPISWYWDFGDGTISTLQNPTHAYHLSGNYTVTLIVSNSYGTTTATKEGYISISIGTVEPNKNIIYSAFLGGTSGDAGYDIAVDSAGNAYIVGMTYSMDFPITPGAIDDYNNDYRQICVCKVNATGSAVLYSTYMGKGKSGYNYAITVDDTGNAYIAGATNSTDFPITAGAFDTTYAIGYKGFVLKLNATGSAPIYSTYLGGHEYSNEMIGGIVVDAAGNAYITGETGSLDFPTTPGAFDTIHNGYSKCFITKLNATGSALIYSTFLNSKEFSGEEIIRDIAVDNAGNAYVTGSSESSEFPTTTGAFNTTFHGGADSFVTKLNPNGSALVYSTYLGGVNNDNSCKIAVDSVGNAYIMGVTNSTDFPTTSDAFDTTINTIAISGENDVFVTKLNATGSALLYSTFLGGYANPDGYFNFYHGNGIAVDTTGNVIVSGATLSANFPTTPGAFQPVKTDTSRDIFITKLNAQGTKLLYSTFLGGSHSDLNSGLALDNSGNVYLTGYTDSPDFPITSGAFCTTYNGSFGDAYITKLALTPIPLNHSGAFLIGSETSNWYLEQYGDGIGAGTLSWISATHCINLSQTPGEKGKLSQVFSIVTSGWYTAVAKVSTDITDNSKQQKVYLYLQELDGSGAIKACGNQVIQPGAGGFDGAGVWKEMQISFYTQETILGVQVVSTNPTNSGVTGSLYLDDIWVYAGGSKSTTALVLTNPSFEEGAIGWLIQPYGDAYSAGIWQGWNGLLVGAQGPGEKAKISQVLNIPNSEKEALGSVWVYSSAASMSETQKVYLYLYSYDSGYGKVIESGNAILQHGKWTPGEWHQLQFGCIPLTTYNAVQLVAINPIGNPYQAIYFDDLMVKEE